MTAYLLADHLLNFIAPAAFMALLLVLLTRLPFLFSKQKKATALNPWAQLAIIFVANVLLLAAGLAVFGNDGKMASYAALVVVSALCVWVLGRHWKA